MRRSWAHSALAALLLAGCADPQRLAGAEADDAGPPTAPAPPSTNLPTTTPADTPAPEPPDAGGTDTASVDEPDVAADPPDVPEVLRGDPWRQHWVDDVRPYWVMPEALGTPAGNYPMVRGMDGSIQGTTDRRPRMLARQIYTYAMGYLLTGEAALLDHASAGVTWLLDHAIDGDGGCHTLLDAAGQPTGSDPRTAQDTAYCAMGLAAWYFVTRDPAAEAALLAIEDRLFDPAAFWDATAERVRDAVGAATNDEVDVEADGGWELVAQLDVVNAFLLLVQPVLSGADRRALAMDRLRTLADTMVAHFHQDGFFWGVHAHKGQYGSKHADFGHAVKTYWMLQLLDRRTADHPWAALVAAELPALLDRAYDTAHGRWARRPTGDATVEYGSDWWTHAELDQAAATLEILTGAEPGHTVTTWAAWLTDFVDATRPAREVVPSVDREGAWVWDWQDSDTGKCWDWKNGFHSTEHALVGYVLGRWREGLPATLHFAVASDPGGFVAVPYIFDGAEVTRETLGTSAVGGGTLTRVAVQFAAP